MLEKLTGLMKKKVVIEVPIVPGILAVGCAVTIAVLIARQSTITIVNNHYIWYAG